MADAIGNARMAVGQVMWKMFPYMELMHILKKGQLAVEEGAKGLTPAEQFYALAA